MPLAPNVQEDFKDVVSEHAGDFSYKPEKKDGRNFVEQKWGWSASKPGGWNACACLQMKFAEHYNMLGGRASGAVKTDLLLLIG